MNTKILYTTRNVNTLKANVCHGGLCEIKDRNYCSKEKKCQMRLTVFDEERIIKPRGCTCSKTRRAMIRKTKSHDVKIDEWRTKEYKKCKAIKFTIEVLRKIK